MLLLQIPKHDYLRPWLSTATCDGVNHWYGGTIEAFYFSFGDDDVIAIGDFPDNESAAAFSFAVNASGAVKIKTTVLMTPEEVYKATKKTVKYRPPGK